MRFLFSALLATLVLASPGSSQQGSPEDAAREYLRVLRTGDWRRTAALMHPEALDELKGSFARVADMDTAAVLLRPMFGVSSAAEFRQMPSQEVYARLLGSVARNAPQLAAAMHGMQMEVIGSVGEGPDVAHVVYRLTVAMNGVSSSKVDVLSFRRSGDRWMALLSGDIRGLAASISRAVDTAGGRGQTSP